MKNMIHTLYFNKPVFFTNQDGAKFYNATTKTYAIISCSRTSLPSKLITYQVKWTVPPQNGDKIEWLYSGEGTYEDVSHKPMGSQRLVMINCCDINEADAKVLTIESEQLSNRSVILLDQIKLANT